MNLLLNALLTNWKIILFDEERIIISEKNIETLWNESEKLIWLIDDFLSENNISYNDLENIVVFAGPWSFTGIRTITLLVNTINFVTNKYITSLNFFDWYDNFPIIKASSKRDSFFKRDKNSEIEIMKNVDIIEYLYKNNIKKVYWENKNLPLTEEFNSLKNIDKIEIVEKINYYAIIKNIKFGRHKKINPIYIKKPSIS
jgi:tRNA A37 threonylcarbamoyladenosine modification protein TsaB